MGKLGKVFRYESEKFLTVKKAARPTIKNMKYIEQGKSDCVKIQIKLHRFCVFLYSLVTSSVCSMIGIASASSLMILLKIWYNAMHTQCTSTG